jgi:hypothetical protein
MIEFSRVAFFTLYSTKFFIPDTLPQPPPRSVMLLSHLTQQEQRGLHLPQLIIPVTKEK